ncbi:MAG TPA: patatin-like phospholipase family protein [Bacteroidota bacterium]|nr:patatin-like phospholipase family protein [Bacteroidota bacterium]
MKSKVALVLSGGGARGLAHIGALKALERHGLLVDTIVGTSMGSFIGGFYAAGIATTEMERIARQVDRSFVAKMVAPSISNFRFVDGERVREYLRSSIGELRIEDLKIPFAAIATDFVTGEEVPITKGPLVDAIQASIALPPLFRPVYYQDRWLIDGGFTNPLPVSAARQRGGDFIIAVNVARNPTRYGTMNTPMESSDFWISFGTVSAFRDRFRKPAQHPMDTDDPLSQPGCKSKLATGMNAAQQVPSIFRSVIQSISIMEHSLMTANLAAARPDILVTPPVDGADVLSFHRADELIRLGEESTLDALAAFSDAHE